MKSFDAKAEKMVGILGEMNEKLGRKDEKQEKTIEILGSVKEGLRFGNSDSGYGNRRYTPRPG